MTLLDTNMNVSLALGRGLFESREGLFNDMKSIMTAIETKSIERAAASERIKNIKELENMGLLMKQDKMCNMDVPKSFQELKLSLLAVTRRKTKRGIATTLDEGSTKQPSKGKIYGRRFNGRFASKATYKYHNKKFKKGNIRSAESVAKKRWAVNEVEVIVDCGCTWKRVDKTWAQKALKALRLPLARTQEPMTIALSPDELAEMAPKPLYETPYEYDLCQKPCPPLPLTISGGLCDHDYCRLGCVCQSISGMQKKLLMRDHCGQHQCMFSCHCQHLTRSRAILFENLSPIMDSKFSFNDLNKPNESVKRKLFIPNKRNNSEDSGNETKMKEIEKKPPSTPDNLTESSKDEKNISQNAACKTNGQKGVRKSERIKDKSLYASFVLMETEDATDGEKIIEETSKRKSKRKRKYNSRGRTEAMPTLENTSKAAPVEDYLEISSDSEDENMTPTKKQKYKYRSIKNGVSHSSSEDLSGETSGMEHMLIRKAHKIDGMHRMHNLLVKNYYSCPWKDRKTKLCSLLYSHTFTTSGVNREEKTIIWNDLKIQLNHLHDKDFVPQFLREKMDYQDFEYIKIVLTNADLSSNTIVILESPTKNSDHEEVKSNENEENTSTAVNSDNATNSSVIVIDDETEEMSDSSDSPEGLITNVGSLASVASNPVTTSSPGSLIRVPFSTATGMSGCRHFQFNTLQSTLVIPKICSAPLRPVIHPISLRPTVQSSPLKPTIQSIPLTPAAADNLCDMSIAVISPRQNIPPLQNTSIVAPGPNARKSIEPHNGDPLQKDVKIQAHKNLTESLNKVVNPSPGCAVTTQRNLFPSNSEGPAATSVEKNNISPLSNKKGLILIKVPALKANNSTPTTNSSNLLTSINASNTSKYVLVPNPRKQENKGIGFGSYILKKSTQIPPVNNSNDNEGKKVVFLKSFPSSNQPRNVVLQSHTTPLLPRSFAAQSQSILRHREPSLTLAQKPRFMSLLHKSSAPLDLVVRKNEANAIEINDSDEEGVGSKNEFIQQTTCATLEKDETSAVNDSTTGNNDSITNIETSKMSLIMGETKQNNGDSGSVSSNSEMDEQQLLRKQLKALYWNIAKLECLIENRDKISTVEILEKAISLIKKLQDTNVELANKKYAESETKSKLLKKLKLLKGGLKQNQNTKLE